MLTIIIVNYKTSRDVTTCLESIVKFEKNYKQYEIVVVDNNSDDPGIPEMIKKFPFIKIIDAPKNGGFAYGNNIGIRNSIGECILLLNPDTYIIDNGIEKLYNRFTGDSTISIVGPMLLNPDMSIQSIDCPKSYLTLWKMFCVEFYLHKIFYKSRLMNSYYRTYMDYSKETFVEQVAGACLMFRRTLIDEIGYLDENYFLYYEESDFCYQAVKTGKKLLYYPGSRVVHSSAAASSLDSEFAIKQYITSFIYYFKKNFNPLSATFCFIIFFIGTFIRFIGLAAMFNKKYKLYFYYLKYFLRSD